MKFVQKDMGDAEEASSARGRTPGEFVKLSILAVVLLVGALFLTGFIVCLVVLQKML